MTKRFLCLILAVCCVSLWAAPVLADGEEPEGEATAEAGGHGHGEADSHGAAEGDGHGAAEDDGHGGGGGSRLNPVATIGGIIAAAALVAGAMMFTTPSMLTLAGLALIGFTGALHFIAGGAWFDILLVLNGIGFIVLAAAWVWPTELISNQRNVVAGVLIVYTLITIIGYFATHDHYDYLGVISKVVEVGLLVVLGLSFREAIGRKG